MVRSRSCDSRARRNGGVGKTGDVRFGVFLLGARFPGESDSAALERVVRAAVAAEGAGFDDVWVAEHHFLSYGVCPSALTLAGYLLGATRRIEVGTAVTVLSSQHPVAVAEQAAMLSAVSGGRLRLGVGRGGPWRELEVFGTGIERYECGFEEALDLMLAWLTEPRVGWSGKHFTFREVPVVPHISTPPPVVVACTSPQTEALAAKRGLPMLLGMHVDDDHKAESVARYGKQAPHIAAGVAHVEDTTVDAVRLISQEMPRWLGPGLDSYVRVDDRPRQVRDPYAYTEKLCRMHPVGSPEHCIASLVRTVERTGIRHVILLVEAAGSAARTLENIARLGEEVLPMVRQAVAQAPTGP